MSTTVEKKVRRERQKLPTRAVVRRTHGRRRRRLLVLLALLVLLVWLAPIIVAQIFEIIRQINEDGTPILLVEQNANEALHYSHRAYVLETGKIILSGESKDLLEDPRVIEAYLGL